MMDGKCIMCGASLPEGEFHKPYGCYKYTKKMNDELMAALKAMVKAGRGDDGPYCDAKDLLAKLE